MKSTEQFKEIIHTHLKERAAEDRLFAVTFSKPEKSIDNCITYILNEVKKSGCTGFADDEIFNMAVHYYDEDDIKVGEPVNCTVVTNRKGPQPQKKKEAPAVVKPKQTDLQMSLFS